MPKATYITFMLVLGFFQIKAQQLERFNKVSGTGETYSELAVLDSGFVTMVQDFYNWNALVVREYNYQGNLVDSAHYAFDEFVDNSNDNLIQIPNSTDFILAQTYGLSTMFIRFNRQWDTLYTKVYQYQDSLQTIVYSVQMASDTTIVFTGTSLRTNANNIRKGIIVLATMDLNFNVLWNSEIEDPVLSTGGYYGVDVLPVDSSYLVGGGSYYFDPQLFNQGLYARFDKQGNLIWKRLIAKSKLVSSLRVQKHSDGNFFYFGKYEVDTVIQGFFKSQRLLYGRFDIQGNLIEEKDIGSLMNYFGIESFVQMKDGNYVAGSRTMENGRFIGHLFCFDEDGNTVWHHRYFYSYPREDCSIENIKATDNGLIGVGQVFDAERRFSNNGDKFQWLLSIDENGCVNPDSCGQYFSEAEQEAVTASLQVFPNPVQEYLQVRMENQELKNYNYTIYTLGGKKILEGALQTSIDVRTLSAGVYFLQVSNARGSEVFNYKFIRAYSN